MFCATVSISTPDFTTSSSTPSSPQYMVGTPAKTEIFSRSMISSAAVASKRGINTKVAPTQIPAFMVTVWPNEWNNGKVRR